MADRRKPSRDEAALWRSVMGDVRPLRRKPAAPEPRSESEEVEKLPTQAAPGTKRQRAIPPSPPSADRAASPSAPLSHGRAADVDRRTLDRLRRGQFPIEAEIDLHGHRQDEAQRALTAFIGGQAAAGRRCVRVVTGRGLARDGGGVLKSAVPEWLNQAPLREQVLAFAHARPDDGGDGALYVLLRRRREGRG